MVNKEVKKFTTNILGLFQGLKSKGISLAKEIKQIFVNDAVRPTKLYYIASIFKALRKKVINLDFWIRC